VRQGGHASKAKRRLVRKGRNIEGKEFVGLLLTAEPPKHLRPTPVAEGAVCCSATRVKACVNVGVSLEFCPTFRS